MPIETRIDLLEEILDKWKPALKEDYEAYKNHVYRVLNYCFALCECSNEERKKLVIAGAFHDLGIWSHSTVDYLPPSEELAREYLAQANLQDWESEIELIIDMHHKIRSYHNEIFPLVEVFRKADLVDVSCGFVSYGLPNSVLTAVKAQFHNAGFHKRLLQLAGDWFYKYPLSPPPFLRW